MTLAAAGCAGPSGPAPAAAAASSLPAGAPTGTTFSFGHPADPADADRTIDVTASDSLRFKPDSVTVAPGETVTFRIRNEGSLAHEFVLGTEGDQAQHEVEMRHMAPDAPMHHEPNAVRIEAGRTAELTWTFPPTQRAPVFFACHEPGHYAGGMKGKIRLAKPSPSPTGRH